MAAAGTCVDDTEQTLSLCLVHAAGQLFGIATGRIRVVLGMRAVQHVPLAPDYIAGIVPHRGEVLTVVSLRALLGGCAPHAHAQQVGCVLVLEDHEETEPARGADSERFGLLVDAVGGVVTVEQACVAANPSTLRERECALFLGAARTEHGLVVRLDPEHLNPARLARSGLYPAAPASDDDELKET